MLTIMFLGLIAHFQIGGIERAVLTFEPNHLAIMIIKASDLADLSEVDGFAPGALLHDPNHVDWAIWNLNGLHLKFKNLPGGATNVDSAIPNLAQITDGSAPLVNIEDGVLHSHVTAYIDYSGGGLSATCSCAVRWTPPQPPRPGCLPSATWKEGTATPQVTYQATATKPLILKGTNVLELGPNATVEIYNVSFSDPAVAPHAHHKDYLGLFVDGDCVSELAELHECVLANGSSCANSAQNSTKPKFNLADNLNVHNLGLQLPLGLKVLDIGILDVGSPECTNSRFP